MITSTSAPGTPLTTSSGDASQRTALGQDAFLQLLVTQLRNQDPLSPLQPHEFAAQLAQFSSVEQLSHLNDAVTAQAANQQLSTLINKTTLSAAMIGRTVIAEGASVAVPSSGHANVLVDVGGQGGEGTLRVFDKDGREVAARSLGHVAGGRNTFALPGGLAAGAYTYEVSVKAADGADVPVTRYTSGLVDSVSFTSRGILLRVGPLEIPLDAVTELASASTSTSSDPADEHDDPVPQPGGRGRIDAQ